jgi:hypothetical protein
MGMMKNGRFIFLPILFMLASLFVQLPVHAHGGGVLYVNNSPVGNNIVSVWVNPPEPLANQTVHFTISISGADREPILDAKVTIDIIVKNTNELIASTQATTDQSVNRLFYESDLPQIAAGDYDIQLTITHLKSKDTLSFSMSVRPSNNTNWLIRGGLAVAIIGVLLYYFRWYKHSDINQGKTFPKRRSPKPASMKQ